MPSVQPMVLMIFEIPHEDHWLCVHFALHKQLLLQHMEI